MPATRKPHNMSVLGFACNEDSGASQCRHDIDVDSATLGGKLGKKRSKMSWAIFNRYSGRKGNLKRKGEPCTRKGP